MVEKTITPTPHTIYMLVGPSNSGKTTFAKKLEREMYTLMGRYISLDEIRAELLKKTHSQSFDKYSFQSQTVNDQAFSVAFNTLRNVISYPASLSNQYVILDSTALDKDFRSKVKEMAKENGWLVHVIIFDYSISDYYESLDKKHHYIIDRHIDKFKNVLPVLKEEFPVNRTIIKKRGEYFIGVDRKILGKFHRQYVYNSMRNKEFIIGDIHGCYDEFRNLIEKCGGFEKNTYILIGDLIDKGPKSKEVLQYIVDNIPHFHIVIGNHESFVYKWFFEWGEKNSDVDPEIQKKYYTSTEEYKHDDEFKRLLHTIVNRSAHCYVNPDYRYIVTHAPCKNKYLGKIHSKSLRNQRMISSPKELDKRKEFYQFLYQEANPKHPIHVFGHEAFKSIFKYKNKIGIDTSCVHGGRLTAINLDEHNNMSVVSVPSSVKVGKPPQDM